LGSGDDLETDAVGLRECGMKEGNIPIEKLRAAIQKVMCERHHNFDTFSEHVEGANMSDPFWEMTFEEAIATAERMNAEEN
jgi:hypothetical protein